MSRHLHALPRLWCSLPNTWQRFEEPTRDQIEAALRLIEHVGTGYPEDALVFFGDPSRTNSGLLLIDGTGGSSAEHAPEIRVLAAMLDYLRSCRAAQDTDRAIGHASASAKAHAALTLIMGGRQ